MEPKIMITGSQGFIGKNVTKLFKNVVGFDIVSNRDHDICNKNVTAKFLKEEDPDVVIHLAANPNVQTANLDPHLDLELNALGTLNVLQCCFDHGIDHFIFSSTSYVYGEPLYLPIDLKHQRNPIVPYGISKLIGESYCRYFEQKGLPVTILRFFNIYGDNQPYGFVVPDLIKRIKETEGDEFKMRGSPDDTRDFLNVEDLAECIELVVHKKPIGKTLNVGGGKSFTILEVAELITKILDVKKSFFYPPDANTKKISRLHADISYTTEVLGWKPKISLEEGLKKLVPNYH